MKIPRVRALLLVAGLCFGLVGAGVGAAAAQKSPRFDVVSIKPSVRGEDMVPDRERQGGLWMAKGVPVQWLIYYTFQTQPNLVEGIPDSARGSLYTIETRMPPATTDAQLHLMLQTMLRERFGMVWHTEDRPNNISVLMAGPPGKRLVPATGQCLAPGAVPAGSTDHACGVVRVMPQQQGWELSGFSVTMRELATFLTRLRLQPVVDETGSKSLYDFDVVITFPAKYQGETPEQRTFDYEKGIQTAFKKQLGLTLDMTKTVKRPKSVLVIDHLTVATPN
jgi:uncharacterized protein (TIGR03435 family)